MHHHIKPAGSYKCLRQTRDNYQRSDSETMLFATAKYLVVKQAAGKCTALISVRCRYSQYRDKCHMSSDNSPTTSGTHNGCDEWHCMLNELHCWRAVINRAMDICQVLCQLVQNTQTYNVAATNRSYSVQRHVHCQDLIKTYNFLHNVLQCFDAVGWVVGRASGL